MEGGFSYCKQIMRWQAIVVLPYAPNGMQLDQMPGYTAWFLQTCFDNFWGGGSRLREKVPWQLAMLIEDLKYIKFGYICCA